MRKLPSLVLALAVAVPGLSACSQKPSTRDDLCSEFSALGKQLLQGNGVFGNPLFRQTKDLGNVAKRYEDDEGVQRDGEELVKLGKGKSLSGQDLMGATHSIANVCGHPLGIGG